MKRNKNKGGEEASSSAPLPRRQDRLNMAIPRKPRTSRTFVEDVVNPNYQRLDVEMDNNANERAREAEENRNDDDQEGLNEETETTKDEDEAETDPTFLPRKHDSKKKSWFRDERYKRAETQMIDLLWDESGKTYGVAVRRKLLQEAASDKVTKDNGLVNSLLVDMINRSYNGRTFIRGYDQFDGTMIYWIEGPHGEGKLQDSNQLKEKLDTANRRIIELETTLKVEDSAKQRNPISSGLSFYLIY